MDVYARLGVRPVINCATTYTRLGGSVMAPHVARGIAEAAGCFVNVFDLQAAVGRRLAELTQNEAAYVSNGAAAGLLLAAAACITGDDLAAMHRLPNDLTGLKNEIVVHRAQRNWYDFAIRQSGATLVEIGHSMETAPWELEAAIGERTAAVFYFAGSHLNRNTLPLATVVEIAHARDVPVVVDAAAQLPPVTNLWHFTRGEGADLAIFSGGKGLSGPQNSGLVVGRADLIRAITLNGPPHQRIGRPLKVAKETMIGLVLAVEHVIEQDWDGLGAAWDVQVAAWYDAWRKLLPPGVELRRDERNEAGEPIPRLILRFGPDAPLDRDGFVAALRTGDPPIEVVLDGADGIALSPHLLQEGEGEVVSQRVGALLGAGVAVGANGRAAIGHA
jgi:L-seryl-tRNA(Ser) seleniumtransferase